MKKLYLTLMVLIGALSIYACAPDNTEERTLSRLQVTLNRVQIPNIVNSDFNLPNTCDINQTVIFDWLSHNSLVITNTGTVTQLNEDTDVDLTLSVTLNGLSASKDFTITVEKLLIPPPPMPPAPPVQSYLRVSFSVGSEVTINSDYQLVTKGSLVSRPQVVMKNYFVAGWYEDISFNKRWNFNVDRVNNDITLYPRWVRFANANISQRLDGFFYYSNYMMADNQYYASIIGLTGQELKLELRSIISDMTPVTYGNARWILEKADRDYRHDYQYARGIYNGVLLDPFWNPNNNRAGYWQREHVWPQSKLGATSNNNSANIASDLHNLRAIDSINQVRGNRYFTNSNNNSLTAHNVGAQAFYPGDEFKGDVARILLYMIVRWPQLSLSNLESEILDNSLLTMGHLDTLLLWHRQDPPDRFEGERNEFIYSHTGPQTEFSHPQETSITNIRPQGNRNPFIDRPELVHLIWEDKTIEELMPVEVLVEGAVVIKYYYLPNRKYSEVL